MLAVPRPVTLLIVALLAAGCSGAGSARSGPPAASPAGSSGSSGSSWSSGSSGSSGLSGLSGRAVGATGPGPAVGPDVRAGCGQAQRAILDGTDRFSAELKATVAAGEQGSAGEQARHLHLLRDALAQWASRLDAVVAQTTTVRLRSVLEEYAGAVRAARARVRSAADLESLSTFDDIELDTAADQFARAC